MTTPTGTAPQYEVFALRYAHFADRTQGSNLIFPDDHAAPMPLDFFVWAVRGHGRTIVLDTGFDAASAVRRNRVWLRSPIDALRGIGIAPETVEDVVISHMHWDHAGNWADFPRARFHVQEAEMAYCTGRCMCHEPMRRPFDVEHVTQAVRHVFAERVAFHAGTAEIAPGITLHLVGGHSKGQQILRVPTARGWVVLASDATHFWHNIRARSPFVLLHSLEDMIEGWLTCERLADGPDHIIPGHDPAVLRRFPAVAGDADTVRLDLPPAD
ncbi:MAG: N-acyl homoserine lactonase family protein [Rhodospirillales bacterium]|nr:N-acyl homoserine lactonase family protein [Rhodospirillales bacterium]MDE2200822.1 N-acyl homoserine lactonase family protein [Rhodospirillales bacterium]MDE2575244.1 N-acyl homoserine lactonase family protein [Rhodospirillales bacterium]